MSSTTLPRAGRIAGALISAGMLFAVVGCGSDDAPPPAESTPADPDFTLKPTAPPLSNDEEPEQNAGGGDYCDVLEKFGDDILSSAAGTPEGSGEFVEIYREIAAEAPADAAEDWNYMADAMEAMADIDYSDPEAMDKLAEFENLGQVAERLGQQVQEECG